MANGVIGKVTAGGGTHLVTSTFYGTCTTAANTAAKIVKLADATPDAATLITGMLLAVKFTNGNTVANPTLTIQRNANTTNLIAAKPIMVYGSTTAGTVSGTAWRAGAMILFVYDGTNWVITDYNDYSIHQNAAITTDGNYNILGGGSANTTEQVSSVNKLSGLTYNPNSNVLINTAATDKIGQIYLTSPSYSFGFLNGSGGTNHGIYDGKAGKWVLMANAEHQWTGDFNTTGSLYLTCTTAANTAAKVISTTPFTLRTGSSIYVTFSNTNTANNPTLNVNGTGAKEMRYRGTRLIYQAICASRIYHFIYDGTYWQLINYITPLVGTCTTNYGTAAKTVTCNGFIPFVGAKVSVIFQPSNGKNTANTAATPTLNINSTGARNIRWAVDSGATSRTTTGLAQRLSANVVYTFVYESITVTNSDNTTTTTYYYRIVGEQPIHLIQRGISAVAEVLYTQEEYDQYVADNGEPPTWAVGDVKTPAVAATNGYDILALGNNIAYNTNAGMRGALRLYGTGTNYTTIYPQSNGDRTVYLPNYAGTMYLVHGENNDAIGTATKPVYVAANGRVTVGTTYAGGTAVTLNNASKAGSTATIYAPTAGGTAGQYLKAAGATSAPTWASFVKPVVAWTAGTTAGPTLKVTATGGTSDAVAIPSASGSASGIVTTGAQTFAGVKTFSSGVSLGNDSSAYNTKGIVFTGGSRIGENSSKDLGIYGGGKIYIKPNSPAASSSTDGMILDGDGLYPVVTNTESLGKTDNKWSNVYATTVTLGRNPTANLEAATKQYVDGIIAANDAMVFKGTLAGAATTTYTPAANRGDTYKVSTAGLINGERVEIGDILICTTDSTAAATSSNVSTVKANWVIVQNNVDGAVFKSTNTFTDGQVLIADGTNGKIKTSGYTIAKSVPSDAVFTDTKVNVVARGTTKAYLLADTTAPTSTAAAHTAVAETAVYLDTTAGKLVATSFSGNGSALTNLNGSNIASGTVPIERIPTGTTSTTVALGNHTHTASLATDTGTSTITLASGGKYKLTAGGSSVIFTMPTVSASDVNVTNTLETTTKYYVTGTTSATTNTGTQSFDTGIYATTVAGELNATQYKVDEAVILQYSSTTESLNFIFA